MARSVVLTGYEESFGTTLADAVTIAALSADGTHLIDYIAFGSRESPAQPLPGAICCLP